MISSFDFNPATQTLTQINQVSSAGNFPVHVATDHTGGCVFAANYGIGSAASYRVEAQGRLTEPVSTFLYPPPPEAPNKHSRAHRATVSPDNRFLLVNDLGLDRIYVYALDAKTAKLTAHGHWLANPGDGPRALRFHPNKKIAYCVNESQPTLHVLGWNPAAPSGSQLTTLQTVRLAESPSQCHPGDIVLDRGAQHAYVSTRRDNTVAVFRVAPDGRLTQTGKVPCGGTHPRHLTLDPTSRWLLVANQDSGNIAVLPILLGTGEITVAGTETTMQNATSSATVTGRVDQPMCLLFAGGPSL
jgi:6-phosphogluconolactonase